MRDYIDMDAYGEVLYKDTTIFNLPLVRIKNFINGARLYITTKGILYIGESKDEKTGKIKTERNWTPWEIVITEPDARVLSRVIPIINTPWMQAYELTVSKNKYNDQQVKYSGLTQSCIDTIMSAVQVARIFKSEDERTKALKVWKWKRYEHKDATKEDYERAMAEEGTRRSKIKGRK